MRADKAGSQGRTPAVSAPACWRRWAGRWAGRRPELMAAGNGRAARGRLRGRRHDAAPGPASSTSPGPRPSPCSGMRKATPRTGPEPRPKVRQVGSKTFYFKDEPLDRFDRQARGGGQGRRSSASSATSSSTLAQVAVGRAEPVPDVRGAGHGQARRTRSTASSRPQATRDASLSWPGRVLDARDPASASASAREL